MRELRLAGVQGGGLRGMVPHLFCAKCGCEHVVGDPPSWRGFLEPEGEEE